MALDSRAAAALVLGDVLKGRSLNQALPGRLAKVNEKDRGLLQQLCYGSLRHGPRLQAMLAHLLDKPLKNKDADLQGLLLCGLFQLESTRIPDHAAVAETVGAVKALKKNWARGMVNAVLRRFLREREQLITGLDEAAAASHPLWLYQKIQQQWPAAAPAIIDANNQQPPMTLRVNPRHQSRDDYLGALTGMSIGAHAGKISPQALQLEHPQDVLGLPGFAQGWASVQDEAAQIAAILLGVEPGDRVLDACAAPGGKACHLLELQPQLLELVAMDIDQERLYRVCQNLERLQLQATTLTGDAGQPPAELAHASFDRILVDAPCSATGVIRRHPDVKLLRRSSDIAAMAATQHRILCGLWPLLRPGGTLLYATCSILDEENSQVMRHFIEEHSTAQLMPLDVPWGEPADYGRQLLPSPGGPDGLFYALLRKRAP